MSDIMDTEQGYYALAKPGGNITALELNQEVNLFGSHVNLVGTTFDTYPPIQDAPVEKEMEKEGSWLGNLITGIVVTAALAGLAVATVVTGGAALAAVALAGAAVGTGVVTGAVAYADANSSHARTWTQFLGNLAMGGTIGATTAASIYGLWTVLPAASQAAGLQVSLWTGQVSSMTISTIPTIATYGGCGLMGANGVFALNEITSIGTGQNWMLDNVFGGNQEAYDAAAMITGMCTMGYMEGGANNATLGVNRSSKKTGVQFEAESIDKNEKKFKYKHNPSENPKVLEDAVEDGDAVYGYRPSKTGSVKAFADDDWSDPDIVEAYRQNRVKYHKDNDENIIIEKQMRLQGKSDEEIARMLVNRRNQNRLNSYLDEKGNILDMEKYNQALEHCKDYEYLRNVKGKTDLEIIESSVRGNPGFDACTGLYDMFYDTYKME